MNADMYTLPDCIICGVIHDCLCESGYSVTEKPLEGCTDPVVTEQLAVQMGAAPVVVINGVAVKPTDITTGRLS